MAVREVALTNKRDKRDALIDPHEGDVDLAKLRVRASNNLSLPATLHDYQWDGIAFLCRRRSALLADEMGLGKTVQATVALALVLSGDSDMNRALIVAPASLVANWISELERWAPPLAVRQVQGNARTREALYWLPIPVLVGSYEHIRRDGLDRIPDNCFDIVILDEAQRIKNQHSSTALACRLLPRKCSWALSATPLENSASDTKAILRFLEPNNRRADMHGVVAGLDRVMLRRRKRDVRAELPPVILQDMKLELGSVQRERYDALWNKRRAQLTQVGERDRGTVLLGLVTKLKMICNFDGPAGVSVKLEALQTICESGGPDARILVFSQFVKTLNWISQRTPSRYGMVTGAMKQSDRLAAIDRFRTGRTPQVLFVSLRAGGVGLNLGEATHVVMFDRWWNPAVEHQAIYRAHRFQRDEPLHVVRFLVDNTIEERIADVLETKQRLFTDVIENRGVAEIGFSREELMEVLDLAEDDLVGDPENP